MGYIKVGRLREGGSGKVIVIKNKETATLYAAKMMLKASEHAELENDYRIVKKLNAYKMIDNTSLSSIISYYSFTRYQGERAIVMDLYKSFDVGQMIETCAIHNPSCLSALKDYLIQEIIYLMNIIHTNGVAHRDIKQSNILANHVDWLTDVRTTGRVTQEKIEQTIKDLTPSTIATKLLIVVLDFGFAIDDRSPPSIYNNKVGTRSYEAPEILRGKLSRRSKKKFDETTYTEDDLVFDGVLHAVAFYKECDIWALGVLIYKILFSRNIFSIASEDSCEDALKKIFSLNLSTVLPEKMSYSKIIKKCLEKTAADRPSIALIESLLFASII